MSRPAQAKERAVEIMRSDPGLHVLAPEGWMAASLRTLVETRGFGSDESRLLAWYDTKVADERRIVGTMNRYFNCSGVNIDLLAEWMRALLVFMVVQRDVGVILAGTTSRFRNVERIEKLLTQKEDEGGVRGFSYCKLTLIYDRLQYAELLRRGTSGHKKRSRMAGFASNAGAEIAFVFWKGEKKPKAFNRLRSHVDPGSDVATAVMLHVPIIPVEDRHRVPEATKAAVLKGSSWETLIDTPDTPGVGNRDAGSDSDGAPAEGGPASTEETEGGPASSQEPPPPAMRKRRRALLRQATDTDSVEVFSNPTHPLVLKEFIHEFKSTWCLIGTPEQGIGLTAALSSDVRVPVLAFVRNAEHKKLVETAVLALLTNALVESRPTAVQPKVCQQTLVDMWDKARAQEKEKSKAAPSDSDSSSSYSDSDGEGSVAGTGPKDAKTKDAKAKDAKAKDAKAKEAKAKEKKGKGAKANKAKTKAQQDKDKKDKKEKDTKGKSGKTEKKPGKEKEEKKEAKEGKDSKKEKEEILGMFLDNDS